MRVRFAPSPTGYLHVGGARTALFNWLFARHHGGVFVLRVEDTDTQRNRGQFTQAIYDGLRWLDLDWDEGPDVGGPHGPYQQSERAPLHLAMARQLLDSGAAYECWCAAVTPDENDADDEAPPAETAACTCRALSEQRKKALRADKAPALRLHVDPAKALRVTDVVRGEVTFPGGTMGDFVIVTSDGRALYNLAAVADDHAMRITHVIRGEEHLANTPKQLLMYDALGWEPPVFAHIPIILNAERRKLSKRDGATSLHDYESMGYVAEALVNFLALLGWSPRDNRELLTREELVQLFDLDGVVKHPAIFETAKLNWMNREYIKRIPPAELAHRVLDLIRRGDGNAQVPDFVYVERVATLLRDRVHTVLDMLELGSYFFSDAAIVPSAEALTKYCSQPAVAERLPQARDALAAAPDFSTTGVEQALRGLAAATGVKASEFIHPLRVALTGQAVSPGIFEVCSILGRERTLRRIDDLLARLGAYARAPEKAVQ
ncbi:MAG: glutamate--tRNA ligase [Candidatus Eremiobacteraeota bacterium]|nr:glutamate--tRNA ligase [Candidatus Eremiobacteraeota bacterium]